MKTNHDILGVSPNATSSEIRRAYNKLALKLHPDKNPDKDTKEQFQEIRAAYQALTKPNNEKDNLIFAISEAMHEIAYEEKLLLTYPDDELSREKLISVILKKILKNGDAAGQQEMREYLEKQDDEFLISTYAQFLKNDIEIRIMAEIINPGSQYTDLNHGNKTIKIDGMEKLEKNILVPFCSFPYEKLQDHEIIEKINIAKNKYRDEDIIDHKLDTAFIWLATKPGCGPIYLIGTCHVLSKNPEDYLSEILTKILSETDCLYTEIEGSTITSVDIPYKNSQRKCYSYEGLVRKMAHTMGVQLKNLENDFTRRFCIEVQENYTEPVYPYYSDLKIITENYFNHVDYSSFPVDISEQLKAVLTNAIVRNKFWMGIMLKESIENHAGGAYAFGAYHNAGKFGLPNLLMNEGYDLKPLVKYAQNLKDIPRSLVFSRSDNSLFGKLAQKYKTQTPDEPQDSKPHHKKT